MSKVFFYIIVIALFATNIQAQNAIAGGKSKHFNLSNNLAIKGYDPVAYFTQGKAIKGKKEFSVWIGGIEYYCSSQTNKDNLFNNPAKYEPQYGGWCAYAMGNTGEKVDIDPNTFKIVDGKLYLFYNAYFNNTMKSWNKDEQNLKAKADKNWSRIFNP